MKSLKSRTLSSLLAFLCLPTAFAQKNKTDIPAAITTPESVETRMGSSVPFGPSDFDLQIELFLNHFVNRSHAFDWLMLNFEDINLLKGGIIMLLLWYGLFEPHGQGRFRQRYELLLGSALLSIAAILVARGLAILLPFRLRPMGSPAFQLPPVANLKLLPWSSFPSDHAVLFFTTATGIFFVSRPLGALALAWVASAVCFPRLYLGVHWPTDILGGAVLGISIAQIARFPAVREWVRRVTTRWHRDHPGLLFAGLFLLTYQISNLFNDIRDFFRGLWRFVNG